MFSVLTLSALVIGYLLLLFALAFWGERRVGNGTQRPWVYSLAMGVHCTSWAFFGTTTQATQYGWAFIPTYLGIILVFLFAFGFVRKLVHFCQQNNISSLADFVAAQFQQSYLLAAMVSLLCFFGVVPYIALQLDAVTRSFALVSGTDANWQGNLSLYVTILMALFAILFGTRSLSLTDKHPGLMLSMAFESIIKLTALFSVGLFVCYGLFDGVFDLLGQAQQDPKARQIIYADFAPWVYISHILLGICAVFCLPRQFHITFIENNGDEELRHARFAFPAYLTLMTLFVLPIALAGHLIFDQGNVSTDAYALALPMHAGNETVTLIAFIGGLSAATSMVIVATLAVGIMISNNLVTPLWLTLQLSRNHQNVLQPSTVLLIRRLTVLLVLGISYFYHLDVSQGAPLVKSGIIAISLLSQTMPLVVLSMLWPKSNKIAAQISLVVGAIGWFIWLLWPSIKASYYFDPAPDDLQLGVGFIYSIAANLACFVLLSWLLPNKKSATPLASHNDIQAVKMASLKALAGKVLKGATSTKSSQTLQQLSDSGYASPQLVDMVEKDLAAQVGGASARILVSTIAEKEHLPLTELVDLVGEASQTFQFNHELLQSSVEHIQQGICVLDQDLNLIAWNQRYLQMFQYPEGSVKVGMPIRELLEFNASRGLFGDQVNSDAEIEKRLTFLREGSRYKYLRKQSDGHVIELNGSPLPSGGFVTTYSDISEYMQIQLQLEQAKTHLETRVQARTEQLQVANEELAVAKAAAEQASDSKTKFLAAAGHDLMQPFNAANLFTALLLQKASDPDIKELGEHIHQSLGNAESLLSTLLDMTKLESGVLETHKQWFPLHEVMAPLVNEFQIMAQAKDLSLHYVPCALNVYSDKKLLRRIIQNLLSNAVRYTQKGKILLGVKRCAKQAKICVLDTGTGINRADQEVIFEEFYRLPTAQQDQGLGLGLTIVAGISKLLGHQIQVASEPGRGSAFSVSMNCKSGSAVPTPLVQKEPVSSQSILENRQVLVVENDPQSREAISRLLQDWGAMVRTATSQAEALDQASQELDLLLLDYHLDNGETGLQVSLELQRQLGKTIPGILNTADRSDDVRQAAAQQGLLYLPKPLKPSALKRYIKQLL